MDKRINKLGCNKEDQSYTPVRHDFIQQNEYYNILDIFWSFVLKPYLTESAEDICPQLRQLVRV